MWKSLFHKASDCSRCRTSLSPLYATVSSQMDSANSPRALVVMRGKVHVESTDGLQSLMPAGSYDLSYYLIYQALLTSASVLYFARETDKAQFLLLYPEFVGKI